MFNDLSNQMKIIIKIEQTFLSQVLLTLFLFEPNFMIVRGFNGHNFNNSTFNFIFVCRISKWIYVYLFFCFYFLVDFVFFCFLVCIWLRMFNWSCWFLSHWTMDSTAELRPQFKMFANWLDWWCTNAMTVWTELNLQVVRHIVLFNLVSFRW